MKMKAQGQYDGIVVHLELVSDQQTGGFFIFCSYPDHPNMAGDCWYLTLEDALEHARAEFGVGRAAWLTIEE